jgi:hypothetical protein
MKNWFQFFFCICEEYEYLIHKILIWSKLVNIILKQNFKTLKRIFKSLNKGT